MTFPIPASLAASCARFPDRGAWLDRLPLTVRALTREWSLVLGDPFDGDDVSCGWVAPARRADGSNAIFKIGMPHMEGEHEIAGLRLLDGEPTVRLLKAEDTLNAMLLERCEPGGSLRTLFQPEQDVVIAGLLKRFWRTPPAGHPFRPLSTMINHWMEETRANEARWHDSRLVEEGLEVFEELVSSSMAEVLLATDLHAGNVLMAKRDPWLAIDPKPFVGEREYDATQHLLNCRARIRTDSTGMIRRFSDMLEVDYERVRLWTFARLAAEPRVDWDDEPTELARIVGPG